MKLFSRFSVLAGIMILLSIFLSSPVLGADSKVSENEVKIQQQVAFNKERIANYQLRRHSFLATGGFMGFLIWILLFINSILTMFYLIIVVMHIRRNRSFPKELIQRVQQVLHDGELGFAMEACVPSNTPLARILFEAFKNIGDGFQACQDAMLIAVKAEKEKLMKPVRCLITVSITSFGLGIFGWGVSMVKVLKAFAINPEVGNFQLFAFSSSQAFYPLLVGILMSGVAAYMFNFAIGKVNRIIVNTEKLATDVVKVLRGANIDGGVPDLATMTQLINYNSMNNIPSSENRI
jgi:biopolymer transport protein ExbB/TolQ